MYIYIYIYIYISREREREREREIVDLSECTATLICPASIVVILIVAGSLCYDVTSRGVTAPADVSDERVEANSLYRYHVPHRET